MVNDVLISVIVPTYNRAKLIGETLNSVLYQTYENWECIVIDDGSTDNTKDIVKTWLAKDKRFRYFSNTNSGVSVARNLGIDNARGEFVVFLDSDDLLSNVCLQNRITFYLKNPEYDFYVFKSDVFYSNAFNEKKPFNTSFKDYSDEEYLKLFSLGNTPFCVMSPLWKLKTLKKLNGFDENLMILEDPDLHYRAFLNSMKSLSNNEGIADSYYRLRREKQIDNKKNADKIATGYLYYCNKHINNKNENFKKFSFKCMRSIFLYNKFVSISKLNQFYFLLLKYKILNYKQIIFQPIILSYIFFKLNSIKGLGFYKLTKYIYK